MQDIGVEASQETDDLREPAGFVQAVTTLSDFGNDIACKAGVPLGGIGAGKIDLTPDGSVTNVTTNNNIECPICDGYASAPAKIVPGGVPGIFWALRDSSGARVLKRRPPRGLPGVKAEQLKFEGKLPFAHLRYTNIGPIEVKLSAFSPLVLGDRSEGYRDSSIPGAVFEFELKNTAGTRQEYTLYFSWQNMCGNTGYYNEKYWGVNDNRGDMVDFRMDGEYPGAWFYSTNRASEPRAQGNYSLRAEAPAGAELCGRSWREAGELWGQIAERKPLKAEASWFEGSCGIVGVSGALEAGASGAVRFAAAWFFPNLHEEGHPENNYGRMYENWFKDSWEAAGFLLRERGRLLELTSGWQEQLWRSNLPEWFKYKLCDDLFPMITNSWYTKAGDFIISEAPTNMGGMKGTIDQRNASQAPYLLAFPALYRSELDLFRSRQVKAGDGNEYGVHWNFDTGKPDLMLRQVGAVPHDLACETLDNYSITPAPVWISGHWPDLIAGYVLQWYAYYCWTNDPACATEIYQSCKAALQFLDGLDFDGDGVPELWGWGSSSYDNWAFPYYGVMPYVATMYIAALTAMGKWAGNAGDTRYAAELEGKRKKAAATLVEDNWTGSYFRCWRHRGHQKWAGSEREHGLQSDSIHISQLAGQWYASMMGLGYILDRDKIERALETITAHNHRRVEGGAPIEYWPAGAGGEERFGECWPHYTEVYYAALAIYESQKDAGLEQLRKIWQVMVKCDARWDSGLGMNGPSNDQVGGRWYMSNTASWFSLLALSGIWINLPEQELVLSPNLPGAMGCLKDIPVFTHQFQASVEYLAAGDSRRIKAVFSKVSADALHFTRIKTRSDTPLRPQNVKLLMNGRRVGDLGVTYDEPNHYAVVHTDFTIGRQGLTIVMEIDI